MRAFAAAAAVDPPPTGPLPPRPRRVAPGVDRRLDATIRRADGPHAKGRWEAANDTMRTPAWAGTMRATPLPPPERLRCARRRGAAAPVR
mgnify:CR=1 FL=1